ncbi:MAG TPA: radical SAM protein [Vicinamibacterales bacterium]|jgi:MoaA/NifB/PqqE/SkfB family radical SAM enzyme|nr:radical SAM protein [Vicinamibacterales bacterium]
MSLNFLATRFQCSWPWSTLVMLCDGRIVCGCADPYGHRVLGDVRAASVHDVWTGPVVSGLRQDLNTGGSRFCGDCPLKLPLKKDESPAARALDAGPLPSRMYIECTAACNISCAEACCAPETGITRTRQAGMLDFDLFCRVVDEAGPSLVRIDFFNYGEAFLHKRAVEMCEYIKSRFPHIYLYTSTNGLALSDPQARRLVHSGIDEVTFSLDGATAESYALYRRRGRFDVALATLRAMADEKRRSGRDLPFLNWRYILFKWNDSDAEMTRARELAAEAGVDRLCWELTDHPEDAYSRRFVPGSPDLEAIRHEVWDDNNLGNAIPGATPSARIDVRTLVPGVPLIARAGRPLHVRTRVHNLSTRAFPAQATYGRRLVRLGAQLCAPDGELLDRDYARAWLPAALHPGSSADVAIDLAAPGQAGRYTLKFDLVSEGIDWFERCGSKTTLKTLLVR